MNIDELRSAQSKERQKSDLQQLRESFYGDVAAYVEELEAERERAAERAEDPFGSPEVQQLTNDIETAKDTAEAIYERRLGKIVKKASLVSAEMANPNDVSGLTTEEQALFDDLVARIEDNKTHMLDVIAGDVAPGAPGGRHAASESLADESRETSRERDAAQAVTSSNADANAPHPEDGLEASDEEAGDASNPRAAEAAAVAGDDQSQDDDADSSGESGSDDGSVPAADLMGGDTDANATDAGAAGANAAGANAAGASATGANATDEASGGDATGESTVDATSHGAADDPAQGDGDGATAVTEERATLRVTQDVGEIYGVDEREYTLSAEDVVTLPEENADVLVEQGAAERLD